MRRPSALRELRRALVRRRIAQIDSRLRLELLLLAVITAAFLFWQTRVVFDSVARARGPFAVAGYVSGFWALLGLAAASLAGSRHARQLTRMPPGPAWLALPVDPAELARHLRWEASVHSRWLVAPAAGVLAAAFGLIPLWGLALLGLSLPGFLAAGDATGCAIAFRASLRSAEPRTGRTALERLLATAARPLGRGPRRRTPWRRVPAWRALWVKDLALGLRGAEVRRLGVPPILFGLLSVLVWTLPIDMALARLLAFAFALISSANLAEWIIAISGRDPFWILRGLPIGVLSVWGARASWAILWAVALAAAHAVTARSLPAPALQLFLIWTGGAAVLIVILGVNYGVTLYPHVGAAQRLFGLALMVAMAVSLMIPLLGWVALLAAVLHSARRVPRWARSEETT